MTADAPSSAAPPAPPGPPEPQAAPASARAEPGRVRASAPLLGAVAGLAVLAFVIGWLFTRLTGSGERPERSAASVREAAAEASARRAVDARLGRLEADAAVLGRVAAASLAVVNLTAATENAGGFASALAAAERVLPASPDLQALRPLAAQGAPSRAVLVAAFPSVASRARGALRSEARGDPALGGFGRALDRLFGRPAPEPAGTGPEAAIGRVEARLAAGDLPGAIDAVDALPPAAQPYTLSWSAAARRRAEIDRRLAAVRLLALDQIAAVAAPPQPAPGP